MKKDQYKILENPTLYYDKKNGTICSIVDNKIKVISDRELITYNYWNENKYVNIALELNPDILKATSEVTSKSKVEIITYKEPKIKSVKKSKTKEVNEVVKVNTKKEENINDLF